MGDGSLSQEEIDALLMGADDMGGGGGGAGADPFAGMGGGGAGGGGGLSPSETDLLTDAFNEAMATAGNQASALLESKTTSIKVTKIEQVDGSVPGSEVQPGSPVIKISMGSYASCFVFPTDIAGRIAMLMMGQEGVPDEIDEAHLSTLSELLNTIVSSMSNGLAGKFNDSLTPGAPDGVLFNSAADLPTYNGNVAKITYSVNIEGLPGSKIVQYLDGAAAKKWAGSLSGSGAAASSASSGGDFDFGAPASSGNVMSGGGIPMNPVNFPSLQASASSNQQLPPNFELLLDVQMVMTVELGRTRKYVKDILGLGEGSIIELDKLAGEPVDLLVNGKLIAKGEVVVIDENFGVRVTDIVGPSERIARMGSN
ncbi:MAG: flagellar motor switch protein FliN [Leptospiraceae bacterium]|nr:flagellar motor switch protein FliN [Leptospiraceae bacterium]